MGSRYHSDSSDEDTSRREKKTKQKGISKKDDHKRDRSSYREERSKKRRKRSRSRSPIQDRKRKHQDRNRIKEEPKSPPHRREVKKENEGDNVEVEKQGPNFETSGKLLEDTNVFNGVVIKYNEPPEARKCKKRWRLYVFKGQESLPVLHMHRQSAYLIGKDRKIVDVPVDHPSCSRQHAVFQYRMVKKDGMSKVLPYIIDLGSSNGTFLNNKKIDSQRYYELQEKDMLKFGFSSREYVLLHDQSKDDESD